jgi:hypothetical protein
MAVNEWENARHAADEVIGYSLVGGRENDETLDSLTGVPIIIENITIRLGDVIPPGHKTPRNYVSVEALIHPDYQSLFKRPRVVFNDGSTGIYRQLIKYLEGKGYVKCDESLPEEGEANATRYDVPFVADAAQPLSFEVRLFAPEGLRKSEYTGPAGDATTWYLA